MLWVILALTVVVGVKYYTSVQMRNLERRLGEVKDGLQKAKNIFLEKQATRNEAELEENHFTDRIRSMKEIIQDTQIRLTVKDEPEDEGLVIDSGLPGF